jgi:predicted acetyltransferase
MKLVKPNKEHKSEYEKLILEWKSNENISWIAPKALFEWDNFEEFLKIINKRVKGKWYKVPAQLFFLIDKKNNIVWAADIRFHINHPVLINYWWHIWYWVAPEYRRKWYGTKILALALGECKKLWIIKALLTCDTDNIASSKIIEKNGWILENRIMWEWIENSRYWVDVK